MSHGTSRRDQSHTRAPTSIGFWLIGGALVLVTAVVVAAVAILLARPDLVSAGPTAAGLSGLWAELPPVRAHTLSEQADTAWARADWQMAVTVLSALRRSRPQDAELAARLGVAHYLRGQALMQAGDLDRALAQFDAAIGLTPDQPAVSRARLIVTEYLHGRRLHSAGDWLGAIQHLKLACDMEPGFRDVARLLYSAHYQQGVHLQARGELLPAQAEYLTAQSLYADGPEARAGLAEIALLLNPPPKKRVVVSISRQRMVVYENDRTIHEWVCSTGEPGRDTRPGNYKILSKMKTAYASVWDLDMPYWMGIYYAGASENGIHAPPIKRSTGQKMWEGLLGRRVSFGCVILSEANARELYAWAEVGTPVDVVK